ncbi:MAG: hypothetical protein ABI658_26515 [Acidimicrobiales bacterium]
MSGRTLGGPARGGSDGKYYRNPDHLGHLVVFHGPRSRAVVQTAYGLSDAANCLKVSCVTCNKSWDDVDVFGAALVPALTEATVDDVVARIDQGEASAGRSAPWVLADPSADDIAAAEAFLAPDDLF